MDRAAAHVYVDDLGHPELSDADRHHLQRVLRLAPGTRITAGDGRGGWRPCRVGRWDGAGAGRLEPEADVVVEARPEPAIAVGFALTKGERPEWTVQKLTEVGVDTIVPLLAARSVARPDGERADRRVDRWRRVAREAAAQCRRVWLPHVEDLQPFAAVADRPGAAMAHPGGQPPTLDHPTILVGPEGGWDPDELEAAAGLPRIDLGPLVVRAETAALVAGALLCAIRTGIVWPLTTLGS